MNSRLVLFLTLSLWAFACQAAQLKLATLETTTRTYTNVTVLSVSATDLYFTSDQGIGNVKLKYLSKELQQRFNYDARAAEAVELKRVEDDKLFQQSVAKGIADEVTKSRAAAKQGFAPTTSETSIADPISERSLLGTQAPALNFDKWSGEKPSLDGKCLLVTFWTPWSLPCQKYIREFNDWRKKFAGKVTIIGVVPDSDALPPVTGAKPEFVSAMDEKGRYAASVGVVSVPSVMLVDAQGIVRFAGHPAALGETNLMSLASSPAQ